MRDLDPTREDTSGQRNCPRRRIGDPNLVDRCVGRTRRSGCVAPLGMRNRRAGPVGPVRMRADAMRRPA
jgi:hypothetical protein